MNELLSVSQRQVLRGYVLQICYKARPLGAAIEVITAAVKKEGMDVVKDDVSDACNYLHERKLIDMKHVENKQLAISRFIAHINADGIDVLEGTTTIEGIEL